MHLFLLRVPNLSRLCAFPCPPRARPMNRAPTSRLAPLLSGLIIGILALTIAAAYASLLYRGSAAPQVGFGFKLLLLGTAVSAAWISWRSRLPGLISGPDESGTVALVSLTGGVAAATAAGSSATAALNVAATIAVASLLTGLLFLLVGRLRLGNLIRYLPYPVVSGFLGGAGLLLLLSGLALAAGVDEVSLARPASLLAVAAQWPRLLPALLLTVALIHGMNRIRHPLFMPGLLALGAGLFFAGLGIFGVQPDQARAAGWLFALPPDASALPLTALVELPARVDWAQLFARLPDLVSVSIVVLIAMLLQSSSLERLLRQDLDINRELEVNSRANMLAGLAGGVPAVPFISDTALNLRLAGPNRQAGLVLAVVCLAGCGFGPILIMWIPLFLLAAILVYFGAQLIDEALLQGWRTLRRSDFAIVLTVTLTINLVGFTEGALLGTVLAAALFLRDYGRLDVIRSRFDAASAPSRVDRPAEQRRQLACEPGWLQGYELEGYLFFGSAHRFYRQASQRYAAPQPPRALIVDFHRAQGLDASAVAVFAKLAQLAAQHDGQLVLCGLSPTLRRALAPLLEMPAAPCDEALDLDHAIDACEEAWLADQARPDSRPADTQDELLARLAPYLHPRRFAPDDTLIAEGEPAPGIFFIVDGSVSVRTLDRHGRPLRLRRFTRGTLIGEMSHYLDRPTAAAVQADSEVDTHWLPVEAIARIEREDPALASLLHRRIATAMAERLLATNRTLMAVTA